jgi:hypothetical protein
LKAATAQQKRSPNQVAMIAELIDSYLLILGDNIFGERLLHLRSFNTIVLAVRLLISVSKELYAGEVTQLRGGCLKMDEGGRQIQS